jgi:hypothetical protein
VEESASPESNSWIACTTDEIIAMKPELYDVLVELPHPDRFRPVSGPGRKPKNKGVGVQRWPVIKLSGSNEEVKASQRDLRRYRSLRRALAPLTKLESGRRSEEADEDDEDDEETHLLFNSIHETFTDEGEEELQHRQDEENVTEKPSWSELAYSSFMWWASAGEREEGLKTEDDQDVALLGNLPDAVRKEIDRRGYHDDVDDAESHLHPQERSAEVEMGIIAYFHRVSKSLFEHVEAVLTPEHSARLARPASEVFDESDDEDEGVVRFESEDLRQCGLDVWSERDGVFIKEFVDLWFARAIEVRNVGVECCGMRIC